MAGRKWPPGRSLDTFDLQGEESETYRTTIFWGQKKCSTGEGEKNESLIWQLMLTSFSRIKKNAPGGWSGTQEMMFKGLLRPKRCAWTRLKKTTSQIPQNYLIVCFRPTMWQETPGIGSTSSLSSSLALSSCSTWCLVSYPGKSFQKKTKEKVDMHQRLWQIIKNCHIFVVRALQGSGAWML